VRMFVGSVVKFFTFLWLLLRNDEIHKQIFFDSAIIREGTIIPRILSIRRRKYFLLKNNYFSKLT
jgi:hypothetical protein